MFSGALRLNECLEIAASALGTYRGVSYGCDKTVAHRKKTEDCCIFDRFCSLTFFANASASDSSCSATAVFADFFAFIFDRFASEIYLSTRIATVSNGIAAIMPVTAAIAADDTSRRSSPSNQTTIARTLLAWPSVKR